LIHGAIAHQPDISGERLTVRCKNTLEVGRPDFFLAVESEFDIRLQLQAGSPNSVERRQHGDDRGFVVARAAGIQPPFWIERRGGLWERNDTPPILDSFIAQRWLEWGRRPLLGIEWLSIVMRVEGDRSIGPRRSKLAKHNRVR